MYPFLNIFKTLPLGDIKHIDGGSASQRVSESILGVANTTRYFPVIDSIDGLFLGEGYRLNGHFLWMLWILSLAKRLTNCWMKNHVQSKNDVLPTALSPNITTLNLKW